MKIGDKVRVRNAASYFANFQGIITAVDANHTFPVEVALVGWRKPVNFNERELMVIT